MKHAGFTLIELLVAMVVLVMVVSIVFVAFVSVTDSAAVARENTQRMHLQQYLWRHLSTNVRATYIDAGCIEQSYAFLGEDGFGAAGAEDRLSLTVALPMDGPQALPGVFKRITYEVSEPSMEGPLVADAGVSSAEGEEAGVSRVLRITEQPFVLAEYSEVQESAEAIQFEELDGPEVMAQVRQIPIASFDVTYFDGTEWLEQWDSLTNAMMPWAVRFRANFPRTEEEQSADMAAGIDLREEADLDLVITLPVGAGNVSPWIDMNHARRLEGVMQEGGMEAPPDGDTPGTDAGAGAGSGSGTGFGSGSGFGGTGGGVGTSRGGRS